MLGCQLLHVLYGPRHVALCLVHVCMLLTLCVAGDLAALEEGDWRRLKLLWRDVELGPGASMGLVGPLLWGSHCNET